MTAGRNNSLAQNSRKHCHLSHSPISPKSLPFLRMERHLLDRRHLRFESSSVLGMYSCNLLTLRKRPCSSSYLCIFVEHHFCTGDERPFRSYFHCYVIAETNSNRQTTFVWNLTWGKCNSEQREWHFILMQNVVGHLRVEVDDIFWFIRYFLFQ